MELGRFYPELVLPLQPRSAVGCEESLASGILEPMELARLPTLTRYIKELSVPGLTSNPPSFDHAMPLSRMLTEHRDGQ